ncbi:MAG: nucleotidyltransferase domain-containing protein [Thaumarchaeota archaeon]|jgi:predicted nucleotidyltransferase|nr:nucleotidyltransferase domain-containing protein [Candidatus Geocrenenecus arthurdayi]MCL7390660.1 nucleotidyltransferase domain-containing protein [Candidatus Geocrenenecus arthurdayi]
MSKLCRVDLERSEEIFSKIEEYKQAAIKKLKPHAIILYGSFARGDFNEGSDVDMVVVADFKEPFLDRIKLLLDLNDEIKLPLEPVGYTVDEFSKMFLEGNSFILEVVEKGRILYLSEYSPIYELLKTRMRNNSLCLSRNL